MLFQIQEENLIQIKLQKCILDEMQRLFQQVQYLVHQHMPDDALNDVFSWFLDQNMALIHHNHKTVLGVDKVPQIKKDNQHILFKLN